MVNSGGSGPDNNNMAPPLSYNEERNILICGPKNSGKSSLAFTLCRGIYPQAAGLLPAGCPGRFEGWSIGACATPISALTATQSASLHHNSVRSRGKGTGSANSSSSKDPSLRPYFVNFTLWEDRPRIGLDQQGSSKKNSTASNVSATNDSAEPKDEAPDPPNRVKYIGTVHDFRRKHHHHPEEDNNNDEADSKVKPKRIWPVPEPHVLVVCYSAVDFDGFQQVEQEVVPEMVEAFHSVPMILVATKCDLKETEDCQPQQPDSGQDSIPTNELHSVTTEMGRDLAQRIGARAFVECSAKEQRGLRHVLEEAVWICFDNWIQVQRLSSSTSSVSLKDSPSPAASGGGGGGAGAALVSPKGVVNRKWSLAATLSSSWPSNTSWTSSAAPSMTSLISTESVAEADAKGASAQAFRSKPCETPRPAISIQDPFSCAFPSLPGTGFVGIKQRKQSYGRAAVKKIWSTYSGGGSGSGGGTSGVSPTKK